MSMMGIHESGRTVLVTPIEVMIGVTLVTAVTAAVADVLNMRFAVTDLDWIWKEGYTPHQETFWDWILTSDADIPYDDMSVEDKIRFHENQIKLITADLDDPTKRAWAAEQMTALAEEYKALESLKNGGPGYPPDHSGLN
jgi:hypothetical protein